MPSSFEKLYLLAIVSLNVFIFRYLVRIYQRRQYVQLHGCKPVPKLPQKRSHLGFDTLFESYSRFQDKSYLQLSRQRFEETGYTYQFRQLGVTKINTVEPENVKTILSTKFQDFSVSDKRRNAFEPLIGHGIFTSDGPSWEHSRQIIRPAFARQELNDLTNLEEHVKALLEQLFSAGNEKPVDLQRHFLDLSLDFATDFLFGQTAASLQTPQTMRKAQDFGTAFDRAQQAAAKFFALGSFARFVPDDQFQKDKSTVHGFVNKYVDLALDRKQEPSCTSPPLDKYRFIDEFSKHTQDPKLLRGGLLNVLLAGRDTTASLLSNLWFVIARRPDIWEKLQAEIATQIPHSDMDHPPTLEDIKPLKYLRNCINESLRLHPPIPRNSRTAIRDTHLPLGGGPDGRSPVFVPAGTEIGYQCYAMQRRHDIFGPDADEFKPERWDCKELRPGWAFLPFNGGPRICLGQQFAINEASYVCVRLLQAFDTIESTNSANWQEGLGLACSTSAGTWVSLRKKPST
ncbi:hypothetical protein BP6252_06833 [Coleophoma cylindrospora]|uniref:Uncharacterized protein n=1 Tax=Coleophoma cylindrospora TaxID=1849047 RepID=A0A3D8RG32_9HELO|nr:hypothetical protein BP6252_06833 [Coleophoma cylindrospora]